MTQDFFTLTEGIQKALSEVKRDKLRLEEEIKDLSSRRASLKKDIEVFEVSFGELLKKKNAIESELVKKKIDLEDREKTINQKMVDATLDFDRQKRDVYNLTTEKKKEVDKLEEELADKQKIHDEKSKTLETKEYYLDGKYNDLQKKEGELNAKATKLDNRENEIKQKEAMVSKIVEDAKTTLSKVNTIKQRENDVIDKETNINTMEQLAIVKLKKVKEEEEALKRRTMAIFQKESDLRKKEIMLDDRIKTFKVHDSL